MAQHCPECGFANDDGASYCARCGAFLAQSEQSPGVSTATYKVGETGELEVVELEDVVRHGAALVIRAGGGRAGESFPLQGDRMTVGRRPESDVFLDDVTVSRDHAVIVRRGADYHLDDCGSLNGTYVNRRRIDSQRLRRRRRTADRQVQAGLPQPLMSTDTPAPELELPEPPEPEEERPRQKAVTIGAVCKALAQEFPDISISKIRYLEDQKLLAPRRTQGGYRLYTQSDIDRLRTILRLQRDEFLPLRVIRQELAGGRADRDVAPPTGERPASRRAGVRVRDSGSLYSLEDVVEDTGADPKLVHELVEFGVIKGENRGGAHYYDETEREIIRAVSELARYGVGGRNLRVFRTSADREAQLLQSILAPALRSRNPERRNEAIEALENLASVTTHLKHLLLIRDLRKIAT